jgi:hypothetical protein
VLPDAHGERSITVTDAALHRVAVCVRHQSSPM